MMALGDIKKLADYAMQNNIGLVLPARRQAPVSCTAAANVVLLLREKMSVFAWFNSHIVRQTIATLLRR